MREITYSEGKTIQEDSYEPRSFHFSAKRELNDDEDMQEAYDKLKEEVKKALDREVLKWKDPKRFINNENVATPIKDRLDDIPF